MKSSTYHFHKKAKILTDFQICISVTFKKLSNFLEVKVLIFKLKTIRSSYPKVFLENGALKIYSKFTGEYTCQSTISIKLQNWCSHLNLLRIFRTPFSGNIPGRMLLKLFSRGMRTDLTVSLKNKTARSNSAAVTYFCYFFMFLIYETSSFTWSVCFHVIPYLLIQYKYHLSLLSSSD